MTTTVEDTTKEMQQKRIQALKHFLAYTDETSSPSSPSPSIPQAPPPPPPPPPVKVEHRYAKRKRPPPVGRLIPKKLKF